MEKIKKAFSESSILRFIDNVIELDAKENLITKVLDFILNKTANFFGNLLNKSKKLMF